MTTGKKKTERVFPAPSELVKKVFLTSSQTRPTSLGSRLKRLRLAAAHSLTLARLRAEKYFFRCTCHRKKCSKLSLRLRAQTLRGFLHIPINRFGGKSCFMHRTRYSQFVFRNNTVCSGKQRGFPVIYRQSDEARQTKPPIISFPLISPLSWAIVQPAAGPLSRRRIGWQKRNGNQPFRFWRLDKSVRGYSSF